jgi:hypothetical protein
LGGNPFISNKSTKSLSFVIILKANILYRKLYEAGHRRLLSKGWNLPKLEEFLTTKALKGAEGRNKALLHASFVRLLRLCG